MCRGVLGGGAWSARLCVTVGTVLLGQVQALGVFEG